MSDATPRGGVKAAWMDEPVQQRRDDVEWGRWKETDKGNWDEHKREEWAASIWQWQKIRRREREERRRAEAVARLAAHARYTRAIEAWGRTVPSLSEEVASARKAAKRRTPATPPVARAA